MVKDFRAAHHKWFTGEEQLRQWSNESNRLIQKEKSSERVEQKRYRESFLVPSRLTGGYIIMTKRLTFRFIDHDQPRLSLL